MPRPRQPASTSLKARTAWPGIALCIGLILWTVQPAQAQVTEPASQLDGTRVVSYERSVTTGLVLAETSEPTSGQHCLRKEYSYDSWGNLSKTLVKNCSAPSPAATGTALFTSRTETHTYSASAENPPGVYPNSHTNAAGQTEQLQHDNRFGHPSRSIDANGLTTTWVLDSLGRKLSQSQPDGNKTHWRYDYCAGQAPASGTITIPSGLSACPPAAALRIVEVPTNSANSPNGPASASYLDPQGRIVKAQTQQYASAGVVNWVTQLTSYDNLGRLSQKSEPHFDGQAITWSTFSYDSLGRVIQQSKPNPYAPGGVAIHSTSYNGRSITATNPRGHSQTREKDEYDRTIRLSDAQGSQQSYQFDAWGNLHQTQDALGYVTRIYYDASGHKARMLDPDMGAWAYQHDSLGQLRSQTNPKGQTATLAYDLLGRLSSRTEPDLISTWYYDKTAANASCGPTGKTTKGQLCETTTSTGYRRLNSFDALGRIVQSSTTLDTGTAYISKISYNADGRVARQTWPTGLAADNLYDSIGSLTEMRLAPSNQSIWKRGTNNARGQFTQVAYGNTIQTRNTYEPHTGLLRTSQAGPASSPLDASIINHSYTYNPLGHLTQRQDTNHNTNEIFSYDSLNRLTDQLLTTATGPVRSVSTRYNALGNILAHSDVGNYTYSPSPSAGGANTRPHVLVGITGQAGKLVNPIYSYDANGNITSVASSNGAARTHTWSSFDNPQSLSVKAPNANTAQVSFLYGSDHQRIREVSSQTIGGATSQKTLAVLHPDNAGALYFERESIQSGPGAGTAQNRHYLSAEKVPSC